MTFKYSVTLSDSGHLSQDASLIAVTNAAIAEWSQFIQGLGTIDVQVNVTPTTRANGGVGVVVYAGADGARDVYEAGTAYELQTGVDYNGSSPDLIINIDPVYLTTLWLDPNSSPASNYTDGLSVLAHEIGHGLGIVGYRDPSSGALPAYETSWDRLVMVSGSSASFTGYYAEAIYGGAVSVTTVQNGEQYYHLGNDASERDGQDLMNGIAYYFGTRYSISDLDLAIFKDMGLTVVSGVNGDPLLDPFYYAAHNPDVSIAHVSSVQHYNQFGWKEGRDPSAFFSTVGYLASNPDVAKAGINPLQHFENFGWKEGRDATARFDNELYLQRNPDVKAAGIDPLQHYLEYGQFEGRQAFAAIGQSASFTHGSFDAEFYLLSNPDVAKTALTVSDPVAFAYEHYETNGWHEGRDPNAYFDVTWYLSTYADVAKAGIDPLSHYDTFGWKEGRNPSTFFNTNDYEAANFDVAAAHVDPLQHFLQFGADEGRLI
ncbi:hypothetical protein [Bradyrhizobium sp. USDA 4502]